MGGGFERVRDARPLKMSEKSCKVREFGNGKQLATLACKPLWMFYNILREKSLAIYFEDSQFRRNRTFNFIVSSIYVDKRSRVR